MVVVVVVPKVSAFMMCVKISQGGRRCQSEISCARFGQVANRPAIEIAATKGAKSAFAD
jgi:hypothetical protein